MHDFIPNVIDGLNFTDIISVELSLALEAATLIKTPLLFPTGNDSIYSQTHTIYSKHTPTLTPRKPSKKDFFAFSSTTCEIIFAFSNHQK